jgi:hypothetical protein
VETARPPISTAAVKGSTALELCVKERLSMASRAVEPSFLIVCVDFIQ